MIKILVTGATVCLFISYAAYANPNAIDRFVESQREQHHIPGLSIAIIKHGKLITAKGYGLANVEHQSIATENTVYQSGSLGKQFTAALIMMLAEQGKLNLEDKISIHLKHTPKAWEDITIYHLLTHTSGLPEYTPFVNLRLDYTDDELQAIAASKPLLFPSGSDYLYVNTGYMLLGIIIKNITNQFYGDLLSEWIFKPCHMTTARIIDESSIIPNRAEGYRWAQDKWQHQSYVSPSLNRVAEGSLYVTVMDLAKWDFALSTETLLKHATLQKMWTPSEVTENRSTRYALGWKVKLRNQKPILSHKGHWQGFSSYMARYEDSKTTVIVLSNLANLDCEAIGLEIEHLANNGY